MLRFAILLALAGAGTAQAAAPDALAAPPSQTLHWQQLPTASTDAEVAAQMALPAGLRAELDALGLNHGMDELVRVRRLYEFMVSDEGLGLRYVEQPTYGIAGSYRTREVNCLSFTMMFIALARASGIHAYAQASDDALAMRVLDDTLYRARHVKVGIDVHGAQYTVDVGWRSVVSERSPRPITDTELVALLHNNNAVEHLLRGDRQEAAAEVAATLALDSDSATIWNNAGVVYWRSGRRDAAEQAYLRALELEPGHIGALSNLVVMYHAIGDARLAGKYNDRLQRARASDPFSQFLLAQELTRLGDYDDAISHFRRAIRLLPNEPTFHRSMAEAYRKAGNASAAQRAINRAESLELRKFSQRGIRDVESSS